MDEIRIALTNLGKYNEGELVFTWLDLPADEDEINEAMDEIGVAPDSEYEEWFITDYEAPFEIGEYDSIDQLNEIAESFEDLQDYEIEAVCEIFRDITDDYESAIDIITNDAIFYFDCDNMGDVAYDWHEQTGTNMDGPLISYVDWDRVGRDMEIEGTFYELSNRVWVQVLD